MIENYQHIYESREMAEKADYNMEMAFTHAQSE